MKENEEKALTSTEMPFIADYVLDDFGIRESLGQIGGSL